jgi:hypothetical protein
MHFLQAAPPGGVARRSSRSGASAAGQVSQCVARSGSGRANLRLTEPQSADLGALLTRPPGPHLWPDDVDLGRWLGHGAKSRLTKVAPTLVVEVAADLPLRPGQWRHPLLYVQHRPDLDPPDVDPIDTDAGQAAR